MGESLVSTFFLHTCSHTFSAADALNKQPPPLPPAAPLPQAQPFFRPRLRTGFALLDHRRSYKVPFGSGRTFVTFAVASTFSERFCHLPRSSAGFRRGAVAESSRDKVVPK